MRQFPYFELSGSAEERGKQAGDKFGELIKKNFEFYLRFFSDISSENQNNLSKNLEDLSLFYQQQVKLKHPDLDLEICSMAKASNLEVWQIYCLNSRTEIYRSLVQRKSKDSEGECTALFFPESKILAQNWDWHPEMENLCVITKVNKQDGSSFTTLTEPGILAKIGMNSHGFGVCLNILFGNCQEKGIPIHILLRALLETKTVEEAEELVRSSCLGTTSNILLADKSGKAKNFEINAEQIKSVSLDQNILIHTNHYLDQEDTASASLPGSIQRLKRARILYEQLKSEASSGMKKLLSDKESEEFPICRNYSMGLDFMVGTVASIIMDLNLGIIEIAKGQPTINSKWSRYTV